MLQILSTGLVVLCVAGATYGDLGTLPVAVVDVAGIKANVTLGGNDVAHVNASLGNQNIADISVIKLPGNNIAPVALPIFGPGGIYNPNGGSGGVKFPNVFNGKSYIISLNNSNYADAERTCYSWGGRLAVIKDAATQNFLISASPKGSDFLWIGLTRTGPKNGDFLWSDGSLLLPGDYTAWGAGVLDNLHSQEYCVHFWESKLPGKEQNWNDNNCGTAGGFICEQVPPVSVNPFPYQFQGNVYSVETNKVIYPDAARSCRNKGGYLAVIKDAATEAFLLQTISQYGKGVPEFWIGATRIGPGKSDFIWSDGSLLKPEDYTDWGPGEPNLRSNQEYCAHIWASPNWKAPQWNDSPCTSNMGYICQQSRPIRI